MAYLIQGSPRKQVPLAGGPLDLQRTKSEQHSSEPTRRSYYCGVVVESGLEGHPMQQDIHQLIESLGESVATRSDQSGMSRSSSAPEMSEPPLPPEPQRQRAHTTASAFNDVLNELVSTERSYVSRLRSLKYSYADPLRKFAKRKEEAILPQYEANTMFGNIDTILPANEAFLADLELMITPQGHSKVGGVGDVALKHIPSFECYHKYYAKREEAQAIFEREMRGKANKGFAGFIERVKYSTDATNRVGLRELLMEPIQRIPRYTLMFRTMIKHMAPSDPQRSKLMEADQLASKIATAETDEQTRRAAVMHCLERSIDGFPANLMSSGRSFIGCIDVEESPAHVGSGSYTDLSDTSRAAGPTPCTLFLFDDHLVIVERSAGRASGRTLSGLAEMEKTLKMGGLPVGVKKGVMKCTGVMDITEVVATDVGGTDFHLYLEAPTADQHTERGPFRPFKSYTVVHPPSHANFDPKRTKEDKTKFLESLWSMQGLYRTKDGRSSVRVSGDRELSGRSVIRTWFNVYQRTDWLQEKKKNKIILHIDPLGTADPLPFGINAPPYVIVRAQPMAGELCRYTVTSSDPDDVGEEDIVHTAVVSTRIVQTIHQFGLFKFRTGRNSVPSTPTSTRSRTAMFGLDAISRNLFNGSVSLRGGDLFSGGTLGSSQRRPKSTVSRTSTITTGTDGSLKFSQRSDSTTGTSVADEDESPRKRVTSLPARKLFKRGRSPGAVSGPESGAETELERQASGSTGSSTRRRKTGRPDAAAVSDDEADYHFVQRMVMDESERDLANRLELARKNSQSQEGGAGTAKIAALKVERTISEDMTMEISPSDPYSTTAQSGSAEMDYLEHARSPGASLLSFPASITPTPSFAEAGVTATRAKSIQSTRSDERRPLGPRSPTPTTRPTTPTTPTRRHAKIPSVTSVDHPLPPLPPLTLNQLSRNPTIDELERVISPVTGRRSMFEDFSAGTSQPQPPPSPASHTTALSFPHDLSEPPPIVKPLFIKKSTPGPPEDVTVTPITARRSVASPLEKNETARRASIRLQSERQAVADAVLEDDVDPDTSLPYMKDPPEAPVISSDADYSFQAVSLAKATREDAESCRRAVKRIKLDVQGMRQGLNQAKAGKDQVSRVKSPGASIPRSPQSRHIASTASSAVSAAESRMQEMRQMIASRNGIRPLGGIATPEPLSYSASDLLTLEDSMRNVEAAASEATRSLDDFVSKGEQMEGVVTKLVDDYQESINELEKTRSEVGRVRGQCELVKKLLKDATAENEIMYEAFNEELDGMFNDVNLPETEAWQAMTSDLQRTKEARNELARENTSLKRKLEEVELQNKEWETLLRKHGLIS